MKAVFLTNLLGFSDNIKEIKKICKKRNILLLEDNCESLGSEYEGIKLGNYGFASTFSFFVGHHMSTIEGGAVCTDDKKLYTDLLMTRSHGWDRHLEQSTQSKLRKKHGVDDFYAKYTFYDLAYNIRPNEINGFLGQNQIKYIDEIIKKREENFKRLSPIYKNSLFENTFAPMTKNSNFAFPIICKNTETKKKYLSKSLKASIEVRPIVGGLMTQQPFYKKHIPNQKINLINAEYVHKNGFYFGNNPELNDDEIQTLLKTFS
jgi:CDP-6-deoxy-D-xylo-4-hexulose-3-dehydrase